MISIEEFIDKLAYIPIEVNRKLKLLNELSMF